jgi:hypothetical protein
MGKNAGLFTQTYPTTVLPVRPVNLSASKTGHM